MRNAILISFQEVRLTSLRKLHTEVDLRTLGSATGSFAYTPGGGSGPHPGGPTASCGVPSSAPPPPPPTSAAGLLNKPPHTPDVFSDDDDTDVSCQYTPTCCIRPSIIDGYSRVFFPLSFIVFNTIYWVTYLNISEDFDFEGDDFVYLKT